MFSETTADFDAISGRMSRSNKARKLRGSRGCRSDPSLDVGRRSRREACDLMVLVPKSTSKVKCHLLVKEIRERLASTGFTHMALTHTIYGRPRPVEDRAETAIASSLWTAESSAKGTVSVSKKGSKAVSLGTKRKLTDLADGSGTNNDDTRASIQVLRRLHVVMENASDASVFVSKGPQSDLLNEYDLISIAPTNDATFQYACASATMADIITLDYTGRGLRLPYRIRSADVRAAIDRGASFEIPLAPALLHLKQRKALVHACRELQNNSLGLKPRVIVSSGDRVLDGSDVGALALRMPGDLSNLCKVIMHFDDSTATKAVGVTAIEVIQKAAERRHGKSIPVKVSIMCKQDLMSTNSSNQRLSPETQPTIEKKLEATAEFEERKLSILDDDSNREKADHDSAEDGFIAM
jgi:RNase P/RNase MRP subunit p30